MQSVGKQHSNAPAAEHWGLGGLSSVLPDKGVSPTAYAGAGGIVGKSQRSIHLKKKGRKSCFWDLVIIEKNLCSRECQLGGCSILQIGFKRSPNKFRKKGSKK